MSAATETDILRAIRKCEDIASNFSQSSEFKFKSYIQSMEDMLSELKEGDSGVSPSTIAKYEQKIEDFKDFLQLKQTSTEIETKITQRNNDTESHVQQERGQKQIDAIAKSKNMKADLFSKSRDTPQDTELRQRRTEATTSSQEIEKSLSHQQETQEQLAKEMIKLTQHLKHNTQAAGRIIKEDMKVLQESSKNTDKNLGQLKHESTRLESHLQKGTNWWLWIALAIVCATFMCMIVFIRFFPKPR